MPDFFVDLSVEEKWYFLYFSAYQKIARQRSEKKMLVKGVKVCLFSADFVQKRLWYSSGVLQTDFSVELSVEEK